MIKEFIKHCILMLSAMLLILIALSLTACHSSQPVVATENHLRDSTKMIATTDTVMLHDSVFVSVESKGDTVTITKQVTKLRREVHKVHDTVAIVIRDSVPVYSAPPPTAVEQQGGEDSKSSVALEAFFGVVAGVVVVSIFTVLIRKFS